MPGRRTPPGTQALRWTVLVPVKRRELAKTRLSGAAARARAELSLAFAADVVVAALGCPRVARVVAVTDDAAAATALAELGALVLADEPGDGLNPALRHGAAHARRSWPDDGVAALQSDLPALTGDVLATALERAAAQATSFVADAAGTGTTLYAAAPGAPFAPGFGGSSRDRHRALGAAELEAAGLDRLRRDVDTEDDLREATGLGLGRHSAAVIAQLYRG